MTFGTYLPTRRAGSTYSGLMLSRKKLRYGCTPNSRWLEWNGTSMPLSGMVAAPRSRSIGRGSLSAAWTCWATSASSAGRSWRRAAPDFERARCVRTVERACRFSSLPAQTYCSASTLRLTISRREWEVVAMRATTSLSICSENPGAQGISVWFVVGGDRGMLDSHLPTRPGFAAAMPYSVRPNASRSIATCMVRPR